MRCHRDCQYCCSYSACNMMSRLWQASLVSLRTGDGHIADNNFLAFTLELANTGHSVIFGGLEFRIRAEGGKNASTASPEANPSTAVMYCDCEIDPPICTPNALCGHCSEGRSTSLRYFLHVFDHFIDHFDLSPTSLGADVNGDSLKIHKLSGMPDSACANACR